VVVTPPDEAWSVEFTQYLVEQRPAAACHHQPIRSVYTWRGAVYDRTETRIALQTRESLVPAIIEETSRQHPYEVPCVVALPFIAANSAYADWIRESTRDPG